MFLIVLIPIQASSAPEHLPLIWYTASFYILWADFIYQKEHVAGNSVRFYTIKV